MTWPAEILMTVTLYSLYYLHCIIQPGNSAKLNTISCFPHCVCCIKRSTNEERWGNVLWTKTSSWISGLTPNLFSLQRVTYRHQNVWPSESAARLMATTQHIWCVFFQLSCFSWMSRTVILERSRTFSRRNYANNGLELPLKVMGGDSSGAVQCSDRCFRTVKGSPRFERRWIILCDSRNEITDQTRCWCCGKVPNYSFITYDVLDRSDSAPRCHNRGTELPILSLGYE